MEHSRNGLDHLCEPRVGALGKTAAHVHNLLSALGGGTPNRICSVEVSVEHAALRAGAPQMPVVRKTENTTSIADQFLTNSKYATLRSEVSSFVLDMLRLTGQDQYILENAHALSNEEFGIFVDVDVYNRPADAKGFHKDTYGRVLFVSLAYLVGGSVADEFMGPEYILNPPALDDHLEFIDKLLPKVFMDDLRYQLGRLPEARNIEYATIPNEGYFGMVDELVHHSTPYAESRNIFFNWQDVDGLLVFEDAIRKHYGEEAAKQYSTLSDARIGKFVPAPYTSRKEFAEARKGFCQAARNLIRLPDFYSAAALGRAVASPAMFDEIFYASPVAGGKLTDVEITHSAENSVANADVYEAKLPSLTRQASKDRLAGKPMPPLPAVRPLVRCQVIAMRRRDLTSPRTPRGKT